jgi:hypothetical protein
MAADNEESTAYEKEWVEKIADIDSHGWLIGIGGAGPGELIEGFVQSVRDEVSAAEIPTLSELKLSVERILRDYYATTVRNWPGKMKQMHFLITAKKVGASEIELWHVRATKLVPVSKAVVGSEGKLCRMLLKKYYRKDMPTAKAVVLAVYLLTVAKNTVANVSGDTQLLLLTQRGLEFELQNYVNVVEAALGDYETEVGNMFLACADNEHRHVHDERDGSTLFRKGPLHSSKPNRQPAPSHSTRRVVFAT